MPTSHHRPHAQALLRLAKRQPMLRASDAARLGIPRHTFSRLVKAGQLQRVARGVYSLPGQPVGEHRSLAEAVLRVPRGVVCLLSALRVHGIGTQAPFEVWLAIPPHTPTPRPSQPTVRVVRMSGAALTEGIDVITVDGMRVPVFSIEKTVADCFKFRNKIGLDVALEALHDAWAQRRLTMDVLWQHATTNRVANVMRPYLEGLTA